MTVLSQALHVVLTQAYHVVQLQADCVVQRQSRCAREAGVEHAREKAIERDLAPQTMEINGVAARPFEQACFEGGSQSPGCCVLVLSDHRAPVSGLC